MNPQPRPSSADLRAQALDPAVLARANINPLTRLATDYLNHYNEVIMLLEMLESCPEFTEDILGWEPRGYVEYFARSTFKDRELARAAWDFADPASRSELEAVIDHMNAILAATLDALRHDLSPTACAKLGTEASGWLKPLVAKAGSVINGEHIMPATTSDETGRQAMVDAVFERGA
ncbi:hypothetical protein [Rhodoplanes sp.]|uniref:hypothetical protein n=1 Tax=Rhodoplanes sp. TaxID=1968906 RepID=UPI0025FD81D5|nr:hypothetical protein [Rhodoplanes sp.]